MLKDLINLDKKYIDLIRKQWTLDNMDMAILKDIFGISISGVNNLPSERITIINKLKKNIISYRNIEHNLSLKEINTSTEFEKGVSLFFGIGGGSKALCKGLPFDVLNMILLGEKLKRNFGFKSCKILFANRITYTNIPKNSEFTKESIDAVLNKEKDTIKYIIDKLGFKDWELIMQTDMEEYLGYELNQKYEEIIKYADNIDFIGGHHYAIEMADIWALIGSEGGGVKLSWFMRNYDTVNGGYIMDEQPFDIRYMCLMALMGIKNNVSFINSLAGAKLYPGIKGQLEKESPYICYNIDNRLLLDSSELPSVKLRKATQTGGGLKFGYYRRFLNGIIILFEDLVIKRGGSIDGSIAQILNKRANIYEKLDFIHQYMFGDISI